MSKINKKIKFTKETVAALLGHNPNYDLLEFQKEVIKCSCVTGSRTSLEIRYDGLKVCFFDILQNGYIKLASKLN